MDVINVCAPGHADPYDSFGLLVLELARHLTRMGIYVNLFAMGKKQMDTQDDELAAITAQPIRPARGGIFAGYPTGFANHADVTKTGKRVGICMWESSRCSESWIAPMNQLAAVISPSTFCTNVFRSCGVTVPIHTIPLGIGCAYKPYRRPTRSPLTFLAFLDRGERKGGLAAQQAFLLAFGDDPSYHLILKMRKPKVQMELLNENMTLIQRDMTEQELYELYCSADVMIDCNKGEGFGLLPREASASGCVVLSTDWGGTADNIHQWGWPLPYTLVPADWAGHSTFGGQDLGMWAEPSIEGIASVLRDVAEWRSDYIDAAWHKAQVTRVIYSWHRFAKQVLDVWRGVS